MTKTFLHHWRVAEPREILTSASQIRRTLLHATAAQKLPAPWAGFLDEPEELEALARRGALDEMRRSKRIAAAFCLLSPAYQNLILLDKVPIRRAEQRFIAAMIEVLIGVAEPTAYWAAFECWSAPVKRDEIGPIDLSKRADRIESMVIVAATQARFSLKFYGIERDGEGIVLEFPPRGDIKTPSSSEDIANPLMRNLYERSEQVHAVMDKLLGPAN